MGRWSEIMWALNDEKFPDKREQQFYYNYIDLSGKLGDTIKKVRRKKTYARIKERKGTPAQIKIRGPEGIEDIFDTER